MKDVRGPGSEITGHAGSERWVPDQSGAGDNKRCGEGPGCEITGHAESERRKPKDGNAERKVSAVLLPRDGSSPAATAGAGGGHVRMFKLNI